MIAAFCRDCLADARQAARCRPCGSPRLLRHAELAGSTIAHVDCDAFYATIEKRDDPALAAKPVIIGGGRRGVVATACYVARTFGVRSAMPMFEAQRLCPHAAWSGRTWKNIRASAARSAADARHDPAGRAALDRRGVYRSVGHRAAARHAARQGACALCRRRRTELGITVSIGLSCNKFLAKIASDLDKPRGFAVLGRAEAQAFLADKPVSFIFGVGKVARARFARDGFRLIADLQRADERELMRRYGEEGRRLARLARGIDARKVDAVRESKSVSAENTFERDIA